MDAIDILLTRGVDKIYPSRQELEKVLRSGKKLRLYQGFDPTGTQLHIGHMVGLRKLRQWQDLGHEVIFLIGDGTGQAGDPSGKSHAREKFFTNEQLRTNAQEWVHQAGKVIRFEGDNPVRILYNSTWLNKLGLVEILDIAQNFSVQQLIERDMYQERIKKGETINLREFLYPLLQGYDSVAMDVDLEQGGSEQTFNMLVGRTLVANYLHKEKFVITVPLLSDSKGIKIGKSEGNVIGLTDDPVDLYGKIMSLGDDSIVSCFTLLTDKPLEEITRLESDIKSGANPMIYKKELALTLVSMLNDSASAATAAATFQKTFSEKDIDFSQNTIAISTNNLIDALIEAKLVDSKSSARRLIEQGGLEVNGQKISSPDFQLTGSNNVKAGKRTFARLIIK